MRRGLLPALHVSSSPSSATVLRGPEKIGEFFKECPRASLAYLAATFPEHPPRTAVPEFIDQLCGSLPLLSLRARASGT